MFDNRSGRHVLSFPFLTPCCPLSNFQHLFPMVSRCPESKERAFLSSEPWSLASPSHRSASVCIVFCCVSSSRLVCSAPGLHLVRPRCDPGVNGVSTGSVVGLAEDADLVATLAEDISIRVVVRLVQALMDEAKTNEKVAKTLRVPRSRQGAGCPKFMAMPSRWLHHVHGNVVVCSMLVRRVAVCGVLGCIIVLYLVVVPGALHLEASRGLDLLVWQVMDLPARPGRCPRRTAHGRLWERLGNSV